jgi:hypothetical protein
MPTLSCDPAYSQLLDTNQELRDELQDGISINKSNEKKIRSLVKEVEQCYWTISLQDNTIIAHEKEVNHLCCIRMNSIFILLITSKDTVVRTFFPKTVLSYS